MDHADLRSPRPRMLRRRSSVELRVSREENASSRGNFMFLSVTRTSTFGFVTSMLCAYAWLVSVGVGSSCLTASLIESAESSLLSFERDHLVFQVALEEIKKETILARQDLDVSRTTCRRFEPSLYDDIFSPLLDAGSSFTMDAKTDNRDRVGWGNAITRATIDNEE